MCKIIFAQWCVTLILLTLWNKTLLQSFNWPKPMHNVPTNKINASNCNRRILKVKIRICANFDQLRHITSKRLQNSVSKSIISNIGAPERSQIILIFLAPELSSTTFWPTLTPLNRDGFRHVQPNRGPHKKGPLTKAHFFHSFATW